MDESRRNFFRRTGKGLGRVVVDEVDRKIDERASHWVRPPHAINELEFMLTCTRCHACIDACEYKVIFPLPGSTGLQAAGTPALDLLNNACRLCDDVPCVDACVNGALTKLQQTADSDNTEEPVSMDQFPRLAWVSLDTTQCLPYHGPECGACVQYCPVEGAMTLEMERPVINQEICRGCSLCRLNCILEPKAIRISTRAPEREH